MFSPGPQAGDLSQVAIPQSQPRVYEATRRGDDPPIVEGETATPRGLPWLFVGLPVAVVTGLVTFIGSRRQLWIDEYVTVYVTKLSTHDFVHLLHNQDLVHALYYVFMRAWTGVFGTSLVALRFPSMIGMAVAAGGIAILGRRLSNLTVGVAAGLIFAALPAVSRYGEEARSYGWVVALAVLSTLALMSALDRPTKLRWLVYTVLVVLLTYLHFAAAMVLLPHGILAWAGSRRRRDGQFVSWIICAAVVTVVAAPFLYVASKQSGQVDWIQSNLAAVKQYPIDLFGSNVVFWAVVLIAVVGAARLAQIQPGLVIALAAWALVPPLFDYVTFPLAHLFLAKYALFTLPAWTLLAAGAFAPASAATEDLTAPAINKVRSAFAKSQLVAVLAAVLVLALASLGGQHEVRRSPLAGEPDFQAAAKVVDAGYQSGDGIVYVGTYRFARIPFDYELHHAKPTDVYVDVSMQRNGWFYPQDCADPARCLGTTPRVWLVVTNYTDDNYTGLPAQEAAPLQQNYHAASTSKFENVRVVLLVRNTH